MKIREKIIRRDIPEPSLVRLCKMYNLLEEIEMNQGQLLSSRDIGKRLGVGSHNIRKDIGYLREAGTSGSGYEVIGLRRGIEQTLGFCKERRACIVGLGGFGTVIISGGHAAVPCFTLIAGFDSQINRLETIQTNVPLYPTYEIEEIVAEQGIELAVIAEPDKNIDKISDRLIRGGIRGIINFTPVILPVLSKSVLVRNIDIVSEFRFMSAMFNLNDN
jgi:redox-sensing transcriptional repressor